MRGYRRKSVCSTWQIELDPKNEKARKYVQKVCAITGERI